jgi:hypothetical protein
MKTKDERECLKSFDEDLFMTRTSKAKAKKLAKFILCMLVLLPVSLLFITHKEIKNISLVNEGTIEIEPTPIAATAVKKGVITIPSGTVNANPFLPYRDLGSANAGGDLPPLALIEPPTSVDTASDAVRIMDTIVSGILFDKYSPSAILNIEGNDYLVKKGDVVNNYHVLSILPDSVTVKLGANVYKAGIGEILTEGSLNYNEVSNLNNKFGGVQ